ncbi:hypothetical protein [Pedococcus soli]
MTTDMMDRAPEGLRALYTEDLGPAPFTVDDIVAGGRRRSRHRTIGTVAGAVAAVAVIGVGATTVLGGASTADRQPVEPARTTTTTPAVTYPGCASKPSTCAVVVQQWSREVTGSTAQVRILSDESFETGTLVLAQRVSSTAGEQDVDLKVVLSPSTTAPDSEAAINLIRNATALPGIPVVASRRDIPGPGTVTERFSVDRGDFARALSVQVDVANHGSPDGAYSRSSRTVQSPDWWSADTVADLVTRIHGSAAMAAKAKGLVSSRGLPHVGCASEPGCLGEVQQWSREVTGSAGAVEQAEASAYQEGTQVLEQLVSTERGKRDVHLSVVVAPTTTEARGMVPAAPEKVTLPGIPGEVERVTQNGGGNFVQSYDFPAARFGRAVHVTVNVANQGPAGGAFSESADDVPAPSWWTEESIADLVSRLYGTDRIRDAAASAPSTGTTTR